MTERYVDKHELAAHLGMSLRWIQYRLADGLPHHRFGRSVRFRLSEVERWLA